jgi:hypothetical protein
VAHPTGRHAGMVPLMNPRRLRDRPEHLRCHRRLALNPSNPTLLPFSVPHRILLPRNSPATRPWSSHGGWLPSIERPKCVGRKANFHRHGQTPSPRLALRDLPARPQIAARSLWSEVSGPGGRPWLAHPSPACCRTFTLPIPRPKRAGCQWKRFLVSGPSAAGLGGNS